MRCKIIVKGCVQRVCFRYFVKKHALDLNLKGSVKNLSNGSVEVIAQGTKEAVEALISRCKQGPIGSYVDEVIVREEKEKRLNDFTIAKT